jgi:hypothetical protein
LSLASGSLALQLTLGLRAVDWLDALVLAVELFADRSTLGLRSHAGGVAASRLADSLALRAAVLLAEFFWATNSAHWTLAVDCAFRAGDLLTLHLALRASTHWVADGRAGRVITLPLAHWVALFSSSHSD